MNMNAQLFGVPGVTETTIDDPAAIGAAFDVGGRVVRPPIAVARIVERVVNGAAASHLDEAARGRLMTLGVEVERGSDGRWRSMAPVRPLAYFKAR